LKIGTDAARLLVKKKDCINNGKARFKPRDLVEILKKIKISPTNRHQSWPQLLFPSNEDFSKSTFIEGYRMGLVIMLRNI